MFKRLYFFLLIFVSTVYLQEEQLVNSIKTEYYKIKEIQNSFETDTIKVFGLSAEGSEVVTYRDKTNKIRILTLWIYGELGKNYEEYYFKNDSLIFAFIQSHEYNTPIDMTDKKAKEIGSDPFDHKKTITKEDRYYFNKNKLIRWINFNNYRVDTNSREFKSLEKNLLFNLEEILAKINKN